MAKVDTVDWKAFRLGDLFEVLLAKGDIQPKQISDGDIPLVSAGNEDNGIVAMIDAAGDGVSEMFPAGCISVSMFGRAFYQTEAFYAVSHGRINVLKPMCQFSYEQGLFITSCLNRAFAHKFDYATMCTQKKLMSEMIHLPATPDGQPDWVYMDAYMSEVLKKEEVFAEHLASLTAEAVADGHKLDTSGWKAFRLGDLFDVVPTKGKNTYGLEDGCDLAYIAASRENNGVNRMIAKDNMADFISAGNCLVFIHIGDAAAGFCHYVRDDFVGMAGKTSCGYLKNHVMTETLGLFLAGVIRNVNEGLYSFGESWTGNRLMDTMLPLPVTFDGQPDWAWMEQYIQQQMNKAEALVEHLDAVWN